MVHYGDYRFPATMKTTSRLPNDALITVVLKHVSYAELYQNGKLLARLIKPFSRHRTMVKPGDVIALKVIDRKQKKEPSIAMNIIHGGKHHGTGIYAYKARLDFDEKDRPANDWRSQLFSSCNWLGPDIRSIEKLDIPAKYVWVNNAPKKSTVLFRYVVGGEKCSHMSNDNYCPCRPIFNNQRIYCYYFKNMSKKSGRCKRRLCETKYECVPVARNLPICVRRFASHQIIKTKQYSKSKFQCNTLPIDPPTAFWVLY